MARASDWNCQWVYGDFHASEVGIITKDDRIWVNSLKNERLGPTIPESACEGTLVRLIPGSGLVAISQFQGTVGLYDWRDGHLVWRVEGYSEIWALECLGGDALLVLQVSGECVELDLETGNQLATLSGVNYVFADSMRPLVLLVRRVGPRHNPSKYVLECRPALERVGPLWRLESSDEVQTAVFGEDWVAITRAKSGELALIDLDGHERWRTQPDNAQEVTMIDEPELDRGFSFLSRAPDSRWLFAVQRPKMRGINTEGFVFDPADGSVRRRKTLPMGEPSIAIQEGTIALSPEGVLHLPDMTWEERLFGEPPSRTQ